MLSHFTKRPPLFITAAFAFPAAVFYILGAQAISWIITCVCISALVLLALLCLKKQRIYFVLALVAILASVVSCVMINADIKSEKYALGYVGKEISIEGFIYDVSTNSDSHTILLKADKADNQKVKPFNILLTVPFGGYHPERYSRAQFKASISTIPHGLYNDNTRLNYRSQGIFVKASGEFVSLTQSAEGIYRFLNGAGDYLGTALNRLFYSELLKALVTGDKDELSNADYSLFSDAGISHLLALSGLHISIILMALHTASFIITFDRKIYFVLAALVIAFYMALTGFSHSVVRAGIMALFIMSASLFLIRGDSLNSLCIALFIILVSDRYAIGNMSLQLSFLASLGIIVLGAPTVRFISNKTSKYIFRHHTNLIFRILIKTALFAASSIIISFSVTLFTFPIIAVCFDNLNMVSLLSNILIIPLSTFLIISALIYLLIYSVPFLRDMAVIFIGPAVDFQADIVYGIAEFFSEMDIPSLWIHPDLRAFFAAAVLIIILVFVLWNIRLKYYFALPLLIGVLCVSSVIFGENKKGHEIHCIDYMQSRNVIFSDGGHMVVYKAGGDSSYAVLDYCREYNTDRIDTVILPFYDAECQGYFDYLYSEGIKIDNVMYCTTYWDKKSILDICEYFQSHQTKVIDYEYFQACKAQSVDFEISPRNYDSYRIDASFAGTKLTCVVNNEALYTSSLFEENGADIAVLWGEAESFKRGFEPTAQYFLFDYSKYTDYFKDLFKDKNIYDITNANVHIFRLKNGKITMRSIN